MDNLPCIAILILLLIIFMYLFMSHSLEKITNQPKLNKVECKNTDCGKYTQATNNIHWKLYDKYKLPKCFQSFPYLRDLCFA